MKRFNYENKIAIVTGASSGIGKEISKILVKEYGCTVYGIARDLRKLDLVRAELDPEKFFCCTMDVCDENGWEKFSNFLENTGKSLDILVNCAGVLPKFSSVAKESPSTAEQTMALNYFGPVYACRHLIKDMSQDGVVINVSSASALCPFAGVASYSASKAALQRYTECLAREEKRVSVSLVLPGFVKTDIMKNQDLNEKEAKTVARFSKSADKVARKILKKGAKRKKRIVIGKDGHFMSIMYRFFPNFAPWLFTKIIKKSHMEIFKEV